MKKLHLLTGVESLGLVQFTGGCSHNLVPSSRDVSALELDVLVIIMLIVSDTWQYIPPTTCSVLGSAHLM